MPKLPVVSGQECIKAMAKLGYYVSSQKGSHITLRHDDYAEKIIAPNHKTIAKGTMRNIIRQAGLTVDEFIDLL